MLRQEAKIRVPVDRLHHAFMRWVVAPCGSESSNEYSTDNDSALSRWSVPSASELLYMHEVFGHLHGSPDGPLYAVAWRVSIYAIPYKGTGILVKA